MLPIYYAIEIIGGGVV